MTTAKSNPLALVELVNSLGMRISSCTSGGRAVQMDIKLSRHNAEKLGRALLRYALPGEFYVRLDGEVSKQLSVIADFHEHGLNLTPVVQLAVRRGKR